MSNIYNHIDLIKIRPWMHIGDNKISSLFTYLCWYIWCLSEHKIQESEKPEFQWFHDWIANHYWYLESTSWWANMILVHSNNNEEEALQTFFTLLEKFKSGKKS